MRNSNHDDQETEWKWVKDAYKATPVPQIDARAFSEKLFDEIESINGEPRLTETRKEAVTPIHAPLRRSAIAALQQQKIWLIAASLLVVVAGGIWIQQTSGNTTPANASSPNTPTTIGGLGVGSSPASSKPNTSQTITLPDASTRLAASGYQSVQFKLSAPKASRVTLVGDFNGWDVDATPMESEPGSGVWTVSVPLRSGRHVYAFVIDGTQWVADPSAPKVAVDAFGSPNSVRIVGGVR